MAGFIRLDISSMSYPSPAAVSRAQRWAGVSAIAAVVLFLVANALWAFEQPAAGASGPELLDFYGDLSDRIVAGGLLSLTSIAISVVFASALRSVLIESEGDELLANVAFGGMVLGAAAGVGAEGINAAAAIRAGDGELSEPLALALFDISYMLGSYASGVGFGLVMLAVGWAALRNAALLPRWLAWVTVAVGVAMITPLFGFVLGEATVVPGFLIVVVLGIRLLRGSMAREASARS